MSKLQETTMTTPEQLKEEFEKEFGSTQSFLDEGLISRNATSKQIADFWLNKIQSLLGEIEGRIEGERTMESDYDDEDKRNRRDVRPHNEALDKALSIIQEYK